MQSKATRSCSEGESRRISCDRCSRERSSSAPRSSSRSLSGPENSTRISGRSQSRSSGRGGSTVMRYFRRNSHSLTTARSSSSILRAPLALSVIGIADWLTSLLADFIPGQACQPASKVRLDFRFFPRALFHLRAHLAPQLGPVHHRLLYDADGVAQHPVHT